MGGLLRSHYARPHTKFLTVPLKQLIKIHKGAPWIIEERRQLLAAIMEPKAEKPGQG